MGVLATDEIRATHQKQKEKTADKQNGQCMQQKPGDWQHRLQWQTCGMNPSASFAKLSNCDGKP
jgi:hypothetical protein